MVLPTKLLEKYDRIFNWYHVTVSPFQQKTLEQFMNLGHWERHLRKVHLNAIRKHEILIHAIREYMGKKVAIHGQNSGLHILLEFKDGFCEKELIEKAKNHGVLVSPVSTFWTRKEKYTDNMIMLGYGGMSLDKIEDGIKTLAKAFFEQN